MVFRETRGGSCPPGSGISRPAGMYGSKYFQGLCRFPFAFSVITMAAAARVVATYLNRSPSALVNRFSFSASASHPAGRASGVEPHPPFDLLSIAM